MNDLCLVLVLIGNLFKFPLNFCVCVCVLLGLKVLLRHRLTTLSLWYCDNISDRITDILEYPNKHLQTLELGIASHGLNRAENNLKSALPFKLKCSQLRRLVLNGIPLHVNFQLSHLKCLSYVDLTQCEFVDFNLSALTVLPNLTTLILFNVWPIEQELNYLSSMKTLRVLDISISSSGNSNGNYMFPDNFLKILIENLPKLTHLDISGTNLAGNGVATRNTCHKSTDIPGLASRIQNPLRFLGLYHTAHWACKRHDIPAIEV